MYTIEDHRRAPLKFPIHGACGQVWKQRGERTGHCSSCHNTFEGVKLFDMHQQQGEGGATICLDPLQEKVGKTWLRLVDGAWRGRAMDQSVVDSFRD